MNCGSRSTTKVFRPRSAASKARFTATVVFPTPPGCVNMLVAGVVTREMRTRLEQMGVVKVFLLDDLSHDGQQWLDFVNEVFHYTVRITDTKFT